VPAALARFFAGGDAQRPASCSSSSALCAPTTSAARGTRFAARRAPSWWTCATVDSILTGIDPAVHGVEAAGASRGGT